MAVQTSITCDVCGVVKGPTNHWWSVGLDKGVFVCRSLDKAKENFKHVCGVEHAVVMFNRFLGHGTLEMEDTKPS